MVLYRRNLVAGATYFFTVTLADRRSAILVEHIDTLRDAIEATRAARPFKTVATVVLPDHIHAVWQLPEGDADYSTRWQVIKSRFTNALKQQGMVGDRCSPWQPRYWEHTICDERDLQAHVDYVHINPVKHGLVKRAIDWPHSTLHTYVERGHLLRDWACDPDTFDAGGPFGERE